MSSAPIDAALTLPLSSTAGDVCLTPEEEVLALFDSTRDSLLRYAISFGLSTHDAEDILQEMFLALFHHLHRGRSRANLRGWTFRVTHNLALKRRARIRTELNRGEENTVAAEQHPDSTLNPEASLLLNERQTRLLAVFRALPEIDRRCLQLRAEGLTYREISAVVRISLGSVSGSLARSMARLTRAEETT